MHLTDTEKKMAAGGYGTGVARCMEILVKFGEAFEAEKMVKIASAHIMPLGPPQLLEEMTQGVKEPAVLTTIHPYMSAFDPFCHKEMGIPEAFADQELSECRQRMEVYRHLGFYQTYTCLPMLVGNLPRKGQFVSWVGSSAQLIVNSLIGARCNRDAVVALASAITGRTPYRGLLLDENRYANVLVRFSDVDPARLSATQLSAVGYFLGEKVGNRNVVIEGMPENTPIEQLKTLIAPLAVTGAVGICHMVGLSPEAPTLDAALGYRKPEDEISVGKKEIEDCLAQYAGTSDSVDMVLFGCPHCTVSDIKRLAVELMDKKIDDQKRLWIGMPHQQYVLAKKMGYTQCLEKAGAVISNACMAMVPAMPIPEGVRHLATSSFKAAHYISKLTAGKVDVQIQSMKTCIEAITGHQRKGKVQ